LVSLEEVKQLVEKEAKRIPDESLYYLCREHGFRRIRTYSLTFKVLKAILAFYNLGFHYVTANMMEFVLSIKAGNTDVYDIFHLLGDYHILLKKRIEGRSQWIVHPLFAAKLKRAKILHNNIT